MADTDACCAQLRGVPVGVGWAALTADAEGGSVVGLFVTVLLDYEGCLTEE